MKLFHDENLPKRLKRDFFIVIWYLVLEKLDSIKLSVNKFVLNFSKKYFLLPIKIFTL